jgi:hypothetical protein
MITATICALLEAGNASASTVSLPIDPDFVENKSDECAQKALGILQALSLQRQGLPSSRIYSRPAFNVSSLSGATLAPDAAPNFFAGRAGRLRRNGETRVDGVRAERTCPAAVRYANNECGADDVLREVTPDKEWECREEGCGTRFVQKHLDVDGGQRIWIGPAAWFKAHAKQGDGYLCIWEHRQGADCDNVFVGRRELLKHLARDHVNRVGGGVLEVQEPADMRWRGAGKIECGIKNTR